MKEDEESSKMLAKMELENGGKLEYRTYALLTGKSGERTKNTGGLLYFVGDRLIFEDFESEGSSMMLLFRKKPKYEKLKFQIRVSDIKRIDLISLSQANKAIKYNADPETFREVSGLKKLLFRNVTQILRKDGSAYYFEIFDLKGFTAFISDRL